MNKVALFAVVLSGFMLSSFHQPYGSSSYASMASSAPTIARSISSTNEAVALTARQMHFLKKLNDQKTVAHSNGALIPMAPGSRSKSGCKQSDVVTALNLVDQDLFANLADRVHQPRRITTAARNVVCS